MFESLSNFYSEEYQDVIHYVEFQLVKGASEIQGTPWRQ